VIGTDQPSGEGQAKTSSGIVEIEPLLWKRFLDASDQATLTESWLVLLCRQVGAIARVGRGILVLKRDVGGYAPAATFPPADNSSVERLSFVAEKAIADGLAVAHKSPQYPDEVQIAWPIAVNGDNVAVVVVTIPSNADSAAVLRHLQWSGGWISALWKDREQKAEAISLAAAELATENLGAAATQQVSAAFLSRLALLAGATRVSFAAHSGRALSFVAMSGASQSQPSTRFGSTVLAAMNEAWGQNACITCSASLAAGSQINIDHQALKELSSAGAVVSVPVEDKGGHSGVLCYEFGDDIDDTTVSLVKAASRLPGAMLLQNLENNRSPLKQIVDGFRAMTRRVSRARTHGEKLALAGSLILPIVLLFWPVDYEVTAPAEVEGLVQRHIVAAQDGIIAEASVRAGESVALGQLIARLDNRELVLERLTAETKRRQLVAEEARALAQRDLASSRIVRAQIEGVMSELELIDTRLKLMEFTAPFEGLVISGDLSQRIGASVTRGETLFIVAPLTGFRVLLKIDEEDIASISTGQIGAMVLPSRPGETLAFEVQRVTPVAVAADGRNAFHVEATMTETPDWVRPGMLGVARTTVGQQALGWVWGHRLFTFLRLQLWYFTGI
jgi:multidrug resistance efflux pump